MKLVVLVVDDQQINRTILSRSLEMEGHSVITAANGKEAITACEQNKPDIILLDVIMPIMDGFETAPVLKSMSQEVYLPIIFLTALDDQHSLRECLDVGGDDFLNKPFDQVILAAKINAHARIRKLSKETFEQKKALDFYKFQTEREFQIVEHIYKRALSDNYQNDKVIRFSLIPAETFNGDILLTALSPNGSIYIFMGDFTGHGLASSIGTIPVSKAFYALTKKGLSIPDIAKEINHLLYYLLPSDMFCAAAILEMSYSGKSLSIWAGGVPDLFIINDETNIREEIESWHMPLGVLEPYEFDNEQKTYSVSSEDRVFIYSDGVTELENENGEQFGDDALKAILNMPINSNVDCVMDALCKFKKDFPQRDDITMLELRCQRVNTELEHTRRHYSSLPYSFNLTLDETTIPITDPIDELVDAVCAIKGVLRHKSNVFLLLTEAYNNALEHGVLKMDSKLKLKKDGFIKYYSQRKKNLSNLSECFIKIDIAYVPISHSIVIAIEDSGDGFKSPANDTSESTDNVDFGRGLNLIRELARSVSHNEKGNKIKIEYCLDS